MVHTRVRAARRADRSPFGNHLKSTLCKTPFGRQEFAILYTRVCWRTCHIRARCVTQHLNLDTPSNLPHSHGRCRRKCARNSANKFGMSVCVGCQFQHDDAFAFSVPFPFCGCEVPVPQQRARIGKTISFDIRA